MNVERWFARCAGIARIGPFHTQREAVNAIRTTEGEPAPEAFVWPEIIVIKGPPALPPKSAQR